MNNERKNIGFAISTVGDRIKNVVEMNIPQGVPRTIFWQKPDRNLFEDIGMIGLGRIVELDGTGVSKSRNAAITSCKEEYIWFLDDDISIACKDVSAVEELIATEVPDVILVSLETKSGKRTVSAAPKRSELLSVGTVQIIINREKVLANGAIFPENMGAGSRYPVCDEPVFLSRLWRSGVKFVGLPSVVVKHPDNSSGSEISCWRLAASRAMLFREFFGFPLCLFASLFFLIKKRKVVGKHWWALFWYFRPH